MPKNPERAKRITSIVKERAERVNSLLNKRPKRVDNIMKEFVDSIVEARAKRVTSLVKERAKSKNSLVKERAKRVDSIVIQWMSPYPPYPDRPLSRQNLGMITFKLQSCTHLSDSTTR